jgi:hypothetical protein
VINLDAIILSLQLIINGPYKLSHVWTELGDTNLLLEITPEPFNRVQF